MADDPEWLTALLRCIPGAALILDGGDIRAVNRDLAPLFGIPRARVAGAPLADLVVPEQQAELAQTIERLEVSDTCSIRLATNFQPLQLTMRRISDRLIVVSARSTEIEHQLSASARGALTHDAITGLANRYFVLEELHRRLHRTGGQPMALIAVWIDDLETVVDQRGLRAGEQVCRQVAERLSSRLRGSDLLGRMDDRSFMALLVSDSDTDELKTVADRLRDEVSFPVEYDGTLVSFTSSVLVATIGPKPPSIDRIVSRVEAVGQKAMASGGNQTEVEHL
jgi:diguanylate cyclase (GGDEF)-like protein